MIAASLIPWLLHLEICVRAGLQKWHCPADIMQLTFSLQAAALAIDVRADALHLVAFESATSVCAKTAAADEAASSTIKKKYLRFNLQHSFFYATPTTSVRGYERATLLGTRQTSVPQISTTAPTQIHVTSGNTYACSVALSPIARGVIDVEIFVEPRAQRHFGGALLGDFVKAPRGLERAERAAVLRNVQDRGVPLVIRRVALGQVGDLERVRAHPHRVALAHFADRRSD